MICKLSVDLNHWWKSLDTEGLYISIKIQCSPRDYKTLVTSTIYSPIFLLSLVITFKSRFIKRYRVYKTLGTSKKLISVAMLLL